MFPNNNHGFGVSNHSNGWLVFKGHTGNPLWFPMNKPLNQSIHGTPEKDGHLPGPLRVSPLCRAPVWRVPLRRSRIHSASGHTTEAALGVNMSRDVGNPEAAHSFGWL